MREVFAEEDALEAREFAQRPRETANGGEPSGSDASSTTAGAASSHAAMSAEGERRRRGMNKKIRVS